MTSAREARCPCAALREQYLSRSLERQYDMMTTTSGTRVRGHVEDGWGKVAEVFRANFEARPGELGAACCVYAGGRPVVDLWRGLADRETNRPWDEDTIALVASTTKGATAICAHLPSVASWISTRGCEA
jgi:CubicO group peptidase (beta-lactamase class C family)